MIKFVCAHLKIAPHKIAPAQALDYYTHKHGRRMCAETAFKNPQRKTNDNKRHTDSRPPGAIYYLSSLFRELCARQPSPPNRQNTKPYTMLYYLCACTHTHARTRTLAHTHTPHAHAACCFSVAFCWSIDHLASFTSARVAVKNRSQPNTPRAFG